MDQAANQSLFASLFPGVTINPGTVTSADRVVTSDDGEEICHASVAKTPACPLLEVHVNPETHKPLLDEARDGAIQAANAAAAKARGEPPHPRALLVSPPVVTGNVGAAWPLDKLSPSDAARASFLRKFKAHQAVPPQHAQPPIHFSAESRLVKWQTGSEDPAFKRVAAGGAGEERPCFRCKRFTCKVESCPLPSNCFFATRSRPHAAVATSEPARSHRHAPARHIRARTQPQTRPSHLALV